MLSLLGPGSIPGQRAKIPQATRRSQKKKKEWLEQIRNLFFFHLEQIQKQTAHDLYGAPVSDQGLKCLLPHSPPSLVWDPCPHGPRGLLELQPLHLHPRQQHRVKEMTGVLPPLKGDFTEILHNTSF